MVNQGGPVSCECSKFYPALQIIEERTDSNEKTLFQLKSEIIKRFSTVIHGGARQKFSCSIQISALETLL